MRHLLFESRVGVSEPNDHERRQKSDWYIKGEDTASQAGDYIEIENTKIEETWTTRLSSSPKLKTIWVINYLEVLQLVRSLFVVSWILMPSNQSLRKRQRRRRDHRTRRTTRRQSQVIEFFADSLIYELPFVQSMNKHEQSHNKRDTRTTEPMISNANDFHVFETKALKGRQARLGSLVTPTFWGMHSFLFYLPWITIRTTTTKMFDVANQMQLLLPLTDVSWRLQAKWIIEPSII